MRKIIFILVGIFIFHLFLLLITQFTAWPEMLSYPFLKNHGYLLYKDMVHPYPPILTLVLAYTYKIFGYKLEVLRMVAYLIILANDLLIFLIVNKVSKNLKIATVSVFVYAIIQPFLEGNMLWLDLAIVPSILLGIFFFFSGKTNRNLFLSGFFIGVAVFTKQTAGIFLLVILVILFFEKVKLKKLLIFSSGPIVIFIAFTVRLIQEDALLGFFNSVLINPFLYWSTFPGYVQFNLARHDYLVLLILLVPLIIALFSKNIFKDKTTLFLSLFLLLSAVLVYPRFSFFHLQLFIAITVILLGYLLKKVKTKPVVLFTTLGLIIFFIAYPTLKINWKKETRFYSSSDLQMVEIIKSRVGENEKVYLLGLPSSLYVLSDKLPPKPWTDVFGWYLEIPGVQEDVVARWSQNPPAKIFWQEPGNGNWFDLGVYQPKIITEWIRNNYNKKEMLAKNIWLWEKKK